MFVVTLLSLEASGSILLCSSVEGLVSSRYLCLAIVSKAISLALTDSCSKATSVLRPSTAVALPARIFIIDSEAAPVLLSPWIADNLVACFTTVSRRNMTSFLRNLQVARMSA